MSINVFHSSKCQSITTAQVTTFVPPFKSYGVYQKHLFFNKRLKGKQSDERKMGI